MRSRSATFELTLLTVLIMVAVWGAITWFLVRWQRSWLLEEVQRGLLLASDTLHSSLRNGMMQNQRDTILDTIERVARDTRIRQIRIIQHRGRVALTTPGGTLEEHVDESAPSCRSCHRNESGAPADVLSPGARTLLSGDVMMAFTPVRAERGCIRGSCHASEADGDVLGVIDVSLSLDDVQHTLARNTRRITAVSAAATVLGGGLIWLALTRRFRRPMQDMLRGIRRVAAGDLEYRIPGQVPDEFGELAAAFNTMSRQLGTLQEGLIQSERLISMGKLAAGVAHEINNPLTGILSYAEDLMEDTEPSDPRHKDYQVIVHEALRCRQIVRGLLDFARQDAPRFKRVHPRVLIESALDVVARQAVFQNVQLQIDIEPDVPEVEVDSVQIEQVLVNLIVNAQQAMPDGGSITVGARCLDERSRVEFSVKDEGAGIPPEIRSRIFEPFFSTKDGKTNGLGLAVCLGIVQQHGGSIDVESDPETGTTFRVVLPIARQAK